MIKYSYAPYRDLTQRQRGSITLDRFNEIRPFMLEHHAVLLIDGTPARREAVIQGHPFPSLIHIQRMDPMNAKLDSLRASALPELPRHHWAIRKGRRGKDKTYTWSNHPVVSGNYKNKFYSNTRKR